MGNASPGCGFRCSAPDHPHACGERVQDQFLELRVLGSPPRLWGTLLRLFALIPPSRITPTPVGNAPTAGSSGTSSTDHPHACGERGWAWPEVWSSGGSPPRLWGTHGGLGYAGPDRRITPTPVGNALPQARPASILPDHPHACGERDGALKDVRQLVGSPPRLWGTRTLYVIFYTANGSPPRLWGTRPPVQPPDTRGRITPTPVGNAFRNPQAQLRLPDHPHACGERGALLLLNPTLFGSPPRLWGTHGNALARICERGSPPRLWGTRADQVFKQCHGRITPTPVGNAPRPGAVGPGAPDHPHACGERL